MSFLPVLYRKKELIVYKDKKINTKRRTFLKKSALAGLALALPINLYPKKVNASYKGAIKAAELVIGVAQVIIGLWSIFKKKDEKPAPVHYTIVYDDYKESTFTFFPEHCPCSSYRGRCEICYTIFETNGAHKNDIYNMIEMQRCPYGGIYITPF